MAKKIIILGKPNVGKSSLFNRLLKDKIAITSNIEGTTRDINIRPLCLSIGENEFYVDLCDTAGLMKKANGIFKNVKKIIFDFINKDDLILYVISADSGIMDDDLRTFRSLKNAVLIVNKTDIQKNENWEYGAFGAKNTFYVSSLHNRGIKGLKDFLGFTLGNNNLLLDKHSVVLNDNNIESKDYPKQNAVEQINYASKANFLDSSLCSTHYIKNNKQGVDYHNSMQNVEYYNDNTINIGIIGRVNVGKSSILNALLNKERSLVSEIEGTTIDPVSDEIAYQDKILRFVDTAGIRRASKIEGIEKFALERTKHILEQSNIVLLVLDSSRDFVELDEKISGLSQKYNLGIIILLNKWDIKYTDFKSFQTIIKRKFAYLSYAPILTISALKMRHIDEIKATILRVWKNYNNRIPTATLNEHIKIAIQKHPIPSDKGKIIKVYYASQVDCAPPQIVLVMNKPRALHFSYKRYLVNYLRANFDFVGVPIIILTKGRNKDEIAQ